MPTRNIPHPTLLWVLELGGYPNFTPLWERLGYRVEVVRSVRKANAVLRKAVPEVVVAEFNYEPNFRDRISNLESLLATLAPLPVVQVIVFYEAGQRAQLDKLRERFTHFTAVPYPVDEASMQALLSP